MTFYSVHVLCIKKCLINFFTYFFFWLQWWGGGGEWGTTDPCNVVVFVDVSTQWLFKKTSFFGPVLNLHVFMECVF